jgi:hypothetical protein
MINKKMWDFIMFFLIIAWSIVLIITINRTNEPLFKRVERRCWKELGSLYMGIVIKVRYGKDGIYYHLNTNKTFNPKCQEQVEGIVEINDSIYKPKGTWSFCIYKQANPDSVILIKCDFDCSIYREGE